MSALSAARVSPCLWFDGQAEAAARFYASVFPNSRVTAVVPYGDARPPGVPAGATLAVRFELDGVPFSALNGGPHFRHSPAVSFEVLCDTQAEVDHYWDRLSEGGDPAAQRCGWLADRFGVAWQVVPRRLHAMLAGAPGDPDAGRDRAFAALMAMRKLDLDALERAYAGAPAPAAA